MYILYEPTCCVIGFPVVVASKDELLILTIPIPDPPEPEGVPPGAG